MAAAAVRVQGRVFRPPMTTSWMASYTPRCYSMPADVLSSTQTRDRLFRIAIDGPAAGGKSSTARTLAARLGFRYVDTGAMYRAITLLAMRAGLDADKDTDKVRELTREARFDFSLVTGNTPSNDLSALLLAPPRLQVTVNDEDVTEEIRLPTVTRAVAAIARLPAVRSLMLQKQRAFGMSDGRTSSSVGGGLVMDGRDIGSVVFPDAELKVFLTAQLEARAQRRFRELALKESTTTTTSETETERTTAFNALVAEIRARDQSDEERAVSPLVRAPDAVLIDTSHMSFLNK
ncbi:Cytidylate kinase-domain-containing protein [Syncephalis fuscata]|nr:Cytidylate kinase-domain-containing protein [Syncephalis fuscata]